jgi:hypothetical protein
LDALKDLQVRLNTYHLKTRSAIQQAVEKILQDHQAQPWIEYLNSTSILSTSSRLIPLRAMFQP